MKELFKRVAAIFLAIVLVIPSAPSISFVKAADTEDNTTILIDENFEGTSFNSNIQGRGATINVTEQSAENHELTISDRTSDWNGLQIPVVTATGSAITASMKVRSANTECILGIQYIPSGSTETKYDWIKNLSTTVDSYVELSGTYNIPAGAAEVKLYLQGNGAVKLENIMVDDIRVTIPKVDTSPTDTAEENFEGVTNIAIARGATIEVVDGAGVGGSKALFVSGRTQNWQGVNFNANTYAGQTVTVSAQVKSTSPSMKISIQIGEGDGASYNQVATGTTGGDEYVTLSGTYNIPTGTTPIYLYIESSDTSDFYVDNFAVTASVKPVKTIQEDLISLKSHMALASTIAGKMGVAIPTSALEDTARMRLVTKHFSSVTCENEMKPESILGTTPTLDVEGNLVLKFTNADKIMDYILAYNAAHPEDVIRVRGHVLLWHSQTPSWFFKENYSNDGSYVSKEVMLSRMDYYFKNVIEHFDGPDSKYKGIIYAWDVVNEQIDNGGIRRSDGGSGISNWYQVFQGDNLYIKEAFRLAKKYVPDNVKLFYNDYGETDSVKADAICKLIQEIKAYPETRIDGMGMQGHYNMVSPSVDVFEKAVRAYAAVVDEIQITELDLQSSTDYDGTNPSAEYTKQAYRYKTIFDKIYQLDQEEGIDITSVTMWGTHDGASWLQSSSSVGGGANGVRKQCPLLFDDDYQAKPAYYGIVDPSQLEPFTNNVISLYSAEDNWAVAPETTYISNGTEVKFQAIWNGSLKVRVQVKDDAAAEGDKIIIYVDEANSKSASAEIKQYSLLRSDAVTTEAGYQGVITIPLDDIKVGKVIGFDVAVINNGVKLSWNDLKDTQETTSKYYGGVTMKPYAEFNYGTPVMDGNLDGSWQTQNVLPLTVKSLNPEATANVRAMWDDTYLYVYADVTDSKLSKVSANAWEQDSLEVFLDQNNAKKSSYESDDCQYRINYDNVVTFNGVKCTADNLRSVTKQTEHGYVVEAAIKWTDVTPANGTLIGVDFQLNDDAGIGSRSGTYNWYDNTGTGYANPSVFGTVTLVKKSSGNDGNNPGSNPDSNTNNGDENTMDNSKNKIELVVETLNEAAKDSKTISKLLLNPKVQGVFASITKTTLTPEQVMVSIVAPKIGSRVYIYRVNEATGKLETIAFGFTHNVDKEGKVSFTVFEGGNYIILTKKADNKLITPLRHQIKVSAVESIKVGMSTAIKIDLPLSLELTNTLKSKTSSEAAGAIIASYQVSDSSIAAVDMDGKITAKKEGKITITTTVKLYNNTTMSFKTVLNITK
jgi:endo-1,4-beta-xylanase